MMHAFRRRRAFIAITITFIGSRFFFWKAGVQFYGSFADRIWQLLDLEWLRTNFIESIFYYHAQPPAFNTLTAILVKLFPDHYYAAFHLAMLFFSWSSALMLYGTLKELKVSKWITSGITFFFLMNPALILYENLYSYTTMTVFLLTALLYFLTRYVQSRSIHWWLLFVANAALLCLTRSTFHILWLVFLIPLLWRVVPGQVSFRLASVAGFVLVLSLYVKNYVLFGSFSSSSWLGMNMTRLVSPDSPLGNIGSFKPITSYDGYIRVTNLYPDVESLGSETKSKGYINFNHFAYVDISKQLAFDSFHEIRQRPWQYTQAVGRAFVSYFNPCSHAPFVEQNYRAIGSYCKWFTLDFSSWERYDKSGITTTAALPAFLIHVLVLGLSIRFHSSWSAFPAATLLVGFGWFILAYGMLVGNMFEYGENNRFRFETHSVFLILVGLVADRAREKIRNTYARKNGM